MTKITGMWIAIEDRVLVRQHGSGLQDYWLDCWEIDPFGNRWARLSSGSQASADLTNTTKAKYRKQLEKLGLFIFQVRQEGKKKSLWLRNLHGARSGYQGKRAAKAAKTEYEQFLQGDYWKDIRQLVLSRDNHTCQHCADTSRLHVHHLTYQHHGEEHLYLDDLITLCESCHRKEHGI